jgi:exodeoxyribonuclease VII large subunit
MSLSMPLLPEENVIFSVSDLSSCLKRLVEGAFSLVRVKGEISGLKVHSSGHVYFSLKDDQSLIDGICWKMTAAKLPLKLEEGMEVICSGRITTYPARSKYQIIVDTMEPAGVGALMKLLQERKERLEKEGLFRAEHKKLLPFFPKTIGVITSPTGAVIRDILHRIKDRFPCHVIVWPVAVQGQSASREVAQALRGFNTLLDKPDLLIVARGGGSLEDLWAFNEEEVVRAVFESNIPVISAVGHETDTTLIDFVADRRAPTPTAAAEMATPVLEDLRLSMARAGMQLMHSLLRVLKEYAIKLESLGRGLGSPQRRIEEKLQYVDDKAERLSMALKTFMEKQQRRLEHAGQLLESYSYQKTLKRGFSIIKDNAGHVIQSLSQCHVKDHVSIVLQDGIVVAEVLEKA